MIHTSYEAFQPKTKGAAYQASLNERGSDARHSKIFRFATWIRNVNDDYTPSKLHTAGKIAVAAAAVFGMIVTSPLLIGTVLLYKFVKYNRAISCEVSQVLRREQESAQAAHLHLALIDALGGHDACAQIKSLKNLPAYDALSALYSAEQKPLYTFNTPVEIKKAIVDTFETQQVNMFQIGGNFVALYVENPTIGTKAVCVISKLGQRASWDFLDFPADETRPERIFIFNTDSERKVQDIKKIITNSHFVFNLVEFPT